MRLWNKLSGRVGEPSGPTKASIKAFMAAHPELLHVRASDLPVAFGAVDLPTVLDNVRAVMERITRSPEEPVGMDAIATGESWAHLHLAGMIPRVVENMAAIAKATVAQRYPAFLGWDIHLDRINPLEVLVSPEAADFSQLPVALQILDDEFNGRASRVDELMADLVPLQVRSLIESVLVTYVWIVFKLEGPDVAAGPPSMR